MAAEMGLISLFWVQVSITALPENRRVNLGVPVAMRHRGKE